MNNLLPTKAAVFHIAGNDDIGRFTKPLTGRFKLSEFRTEVANLLDLIPIEEQQNINYIINPVDLLELFTSHIAQEIKNTLENSLQKLIEREEQGIFRTFSMNYQRILNGDVDEYHSFCNSLNTIFLDRKAKFLKTDIFTYHQNKYSNSSSLKSNMHSISEQFTILSNVLLMSILIEFKKDKTKKYFSEIKEFPQDIQEIKNFLLNKLGTINNSRNSHLENFLIYAILEEPALLTKYTNATGKQLSDKEKGKLFLSKLTPINRDKDGHELNASSLNGYGYDKKYLTEDDCCVYRNYHLEITDSLKEHYETLLDLIAYINLIENLYRSLCQITDNGEFPKEYLFMIQNKEA